MSGSEDNTEQNEQTEEEINPLTMSDEDFAKMPLPGSEEESVVEEPVIVEDKQEKKDPALEDNEEKKEPEVVIPPVGSEKEKSSEENKEEPEPEKTEAKEKPEVTDTDTTDTTEVSEPVNYEEFYGKIMKPFKANGKEIKLNTPEEAIQLMQMGANYTKKMQDLQPHRKMLLMIQNNALDEDKLSYLIDLDKKNPEAIKKLIKDSGIDPLEIDTAIEPAYQEGNHRVTDEEAGFRTALDELSSNPEGLETVKLINSDWDQASKDVLWEKPDIMAVIHEQRVNGIYDRIADEVARQKTLGKIPVSVSFLQAYKMVGDEIYAGEKPTQQVPVKETPVEKEAPTLVATRTANPKATVEADDKVSAASPSRSTPRKAESIINPLAMSDDDFLKQFNGRL